MKKGMVMILSGIFTMVMLLSLAIIACEGAAEPIKVGIVSEWDYSHGLGVKKGAQMAIRDINDAGGLLGRKIEGIYYDDKCDIEEGKKATERLIYKDKVDVIGGFWRSDIAIAIQPLIMEAKKIALFAGSASPVLTYERVAQNYNFYKYTFTCNPNSLYTNKAFAAQIELARDKLGLNKLAVVIEKAAWADPLYNDTIKKFANMLVYSTRFSPTATDFSVEFTRAKAAGANILSYVCTGKGDIAGVKQWHDMQMPMLMVGTALSSMDPKFWELTEGKGDGVIGVHYPGNVGFPVTSKSRKYYTEYNKMFGEYPKSHACGMIYDALMAWAVGVKLANTLDSDAVVKAMESPKFYYEGVISIIERWDKVHQPVGGGWGEGEGWGFGLIQWRKGKMEVIYPDKIKTADISIPERLEKLMGGKK